MNREEFAASLEMAKPAADFTPWLKALWHDAKGEWEIAHDTIQDLSDPYSAWIHAYLHRKEGDIYNADFWYVRAGKTRPNETFATEWKEILDELIEVRI